ncbi:MAG: DUF5677 domain-containing protein [Actinomycetota bacterium]|nr:DUF5677 domain-containing protein [Actinomycetota bacterium]
MQVLHDALESAMGEAPGQVLEKLLEKKLAEQGVSTSDAEITRLRDAILAGQSDELSVKSWRPWMRGQVSIEITGEEVNEAAEKLLACLPGLVEDISTSLAADILRNLDRLWPRQRRWEVKNCRAFERRLRQRWGRAFDSLHMMLVITREYGDGMNTELRRPDFPEPHKMDILTRLHARGSQIANEILVLLESGLADGAMARWRTLHEVATIALFISANDDSLAERYALHQVIESRRACRDYIACQERLGYEPMDPDELRELDKQCAGLLERFGEPFGTNYGWASEVLGNKKPSFGDIERAAGIDHSRAHYRMASHNVHANPKGVFFKLGLLGEVDVLLAGPSNAGMSEPGQSAAIAMLQISGALMTLQPNLDGIVTLRVLQSMVDRVCDEFHGAHTQLAEDSA